MTEQTHDKRLAELFWPAKRARPKCQGTGNVHWTMRFVSLPRYQVIGGRRVRCSMCGGSGDERIAKQIGDG